MLEDQVAYLLQRYLGNYVRGLNKEALKISVWQGDVELTNMQLKPEALNALKLPVKVKAGFLGSVKIKVPWSRLGQDPVLVYLDRIFLLAEPATQVEGSSEDAVQEAKKNLIREMEMKLLEKRKQLDSEMNKSWLGSLINTVIGNLKLSISNVHIRYEDLESNPGHPFAAGITLDKLSAFTVDDNGKETFVTEGALERIQKAVELDRMAIYLDSDISPWYINKPWEDLLPAEWSQIFKFGTRDGKAEVSTMEKHSYILQPVSGNANYSKDRPNTSTNRGQPLQKAVVNLDDVTLCLSKSCYRDFLKLADNFTSFNQRLRYCHYRPRVSLKTDPKSWWKYAYKAVSDQIKKASGKMSWDQVLRYALLRKKYISLYAALLKADLDRTIVDDNEEIEELDMGLDNEVILQWRMLAHKVVEQSVGSELYLKRQEPKKSWWSFGWTNQPVKDENEPGTLTEDDWKRLNDIIGYNKDGDDEQLLLNGKRDLQLIDLDLHMRHNASKLIDGQECLADLSCDNLDCRVKLYSEAKVFEIKLGSYRLVSPNGLLAESESTSDSLVGVFCYKPLDADVDWSMVAKASPCYMTYLNDSINQIIDFFQSNAAVSQNLARETASAVQMTIDEVRRTATRQVNKALKERTRFFLDLNIAAPKITIPTNFYPDSIHPTKLLLDLGKLVIRSQDDVEYASPEEMNLYSQFDLILKDVSAFLVDGDYNWSQTSLARSNGSSNRSFVSFLPVIDKCGVFLKLQQIRSPVASFPSTRLALRLPSLGFHFSPSRYHRLMQVVKIFQGKDAESLDLARPWDQADWGGWLYHLTWKGVAGREAVWQRRYFCIVGPLLYVLENPESRTYKHYFSLRGKQVHQVPVDSVGNVEHVLGICDADRPITKVVEDPNSIILRCESDASRKTWQNYIQGAIYGASGTASVTGLVESSSDSETSEIDNHEASDLSAIEKMFVTGILDELKISFSYTSQENMHGEGLMNLLLAEERRLLEFRAIGGQVELSMKANDIFIGTVLKALEIEDLNYRKGSQSYYLARSFIRSAESPSPLHTSEIPSASNNDLFSQYEGDDEFFEAPESLNDTIGSPIAPTVEPEYIVSRILEESDWPDLKAPSFIRVGGLLPLDGAHLDAGQTGVTDPLDTFVKAQILIFDQDSRLYANVDKQVAVTLSTLSFYCRRPTILAIMDFVNAISIAEDDPESFSDASSTAGTPHDTSQETVMDDQASAPVEEPVIKSLLGKGKSRVIFNISLNMARAQIFLVKEDGSRLATLAQNNLLTDIKVFPSSFSIKASLGNLRISDDSLDSNHMYFWACDMRNPGGSSFVELSFCSYSPNDDDYEGYEYSLLGQLSEVRVVYLNRFLQEVISFFMGLVPSASKDDIRIKDQVTDSDKWLTKSEVEGSPAFMLNLSLKKPIILMPRRTSSSDYLKLDVVQITVQNAFRWFGGSRREMKAVHVEVLTILVDDINLNVGSGSELGESIIQDVKGVSIVIQRALRDLLHQIPSTEVAITIEELKASLSNREYEIITECAQENISETPDIVPHLRNESSAISTEESKHTDRHVVDAEKSERQPSEKWVETKISLHVGLVELGLHYGISRDTSLATLQVGSVWLLYKSNSAGEGFLSATLKDLTVVDDREGTAQELRLAVGKPDMTASNSSQSLNDNIGSRHVGINYLEENLKKFVPAMLILDARFCEDSTYIFLSIQRPQLLVALDFLLAVVEFFVPTVRGEMLSDDNANPSNIVDALILDGPTFYQPTTEFSISPQRPLIADDERHDLFIYDGRGGTLYLKDRHGLSLCCPSMEALVYVGNGKKLQFRNVTIKSGLYLDSCILLGLNSMYSANENDNVFMDGENGSPSDHPPREGNSIASQNASAGKSTEMVFELQAISPELTFYNTSRDVGSVILSNKLLHAQLDAFCRLVLKGDKIEMSADALGLTVESNGIEILEPFDTSVKFSNASGKMSMQLVVSDIFMNFSFSLLRLFLAVQDDILSFLRTRSKRSTIPCSEFDRIGTIKSNEQVYAFWRPRAPTGFAVLGDYLTPTDKPPTKSVLAVNSSLIRVKRAKSFTLVWPTSSSISAGVGVTELITAESGFEGNEFCSIWFPEAPKGYVALGCVASTGRKEPPVSSVFCISASLVSTCGLRDCIHLQLGSGYPNLAFWRVDNAFGTFLPTDPATLSLTKRAYELRDLYFGFWEISTENLSLEKQTSVSVGNDTIQSERSSAMNSRRRFEAVATFKLIWWNQGSGSRKKMSIWRPVLPEDMIYFGDIAIQGYEPPNTCIVLRDSEDSDLYRSPTDFQLVGHIKKKARLDSISFWMPQAPPGFVSLGCLACKGTPKHSDFSSLRCIRNDLVSPDQFLDESIWDTSELRFTRDPVSVWAVGNELGTFIVRNGMKKPPKRFAFKLVDQDISSGSDDTVIEAEISTFSAALFDDYGGLMVPLCNISLSGVAFSLHGRPDSLHSNVTFSLAARSYNDRFESWEPVIEPVDGSLRYQYNPETPGMASQLRITSTRDLNLNVSVSNANTILQAYASWNNLIHVPESSGENSLSQEANSPTCDGGPMVAVHQKINHYIVPQNKLGQDIFIKTSEVEGLPGIIKMPADDRNTLRVPVPKTMLNSHLKRSLLQKQRMMVTIVVADAELKKVAGLSSHQYSVAVRLCKDSRSSNQSHLKQQSARTSGSDSDGSDQTDNELVKWNEVFFFKIDSLDSYTVDFTVTEIGKGESIGYYSSSLQQLIGDRDAAASHNYLNDLKWLELSGGSDLDVSCSTYGRIRCAVLLPPRSDNSDKSHFGYSESSSIQVSPKQEGPWTTVKLNYGAPTGCWQLGSDVVASEVSVTGGNRYVSIRSLVSVRNSTEFSLDICLKLKASSRNTNPIAGTREKTQYDIKELATEEFIEREKYNSATDWVPHTKFDKEASGVDLPSGWEWIDEWHVDNSSVNTADGWVYAPNLESLKWPESYNSSNHVNFARQRRWIRRRKQMDVDSRSPIIIGPLRPGESVSLPLPCVAQSALYVLQLRPSSTEIANAYSWSSVVEMSGKPQDPVKPDETAEIFVSNLSVSDKILYCSPISGSSSSSFHGMWFCLNTQATEIAKDIHLNPIQDWTIVVKPPVSVAYYLPLRAEISLLQMQAGGHFKSCFEGVIGTAETVKVYEADLRNPLYLSLLPQRGWLPIQESVLLSHPSDLPAKTISFRSSDSGRIVQVIIEQSHTNDRPLQPKNFKIYAPYWFGIARCPSLSFRFVNVGVRRSKRFPLFQSKRAKEVIFEEITEEELHEGYTIASALNFKSLGISACISESGDESFGPVKDLSPLADMDGSLDLFAYKADGNCMHLFVSSKPCTYQSVPTKVISVRPFMTFTNRVGQDMLVKFSSDDEPKTLRVSDARVSFTYHKVDGPAKIQVRLEDTEWSFPIQIKKEDSLTLALKNCDGMWRFLRMEIRGYEEGSRYTVVFRLGSQNGPIRIENRTRDYTIRFRQTGFGDDAWNQLQPLSTANFSWEDPYGEKIVDAEIHKGDNAVVHKFDLDKSGFSSLNDGSGLFLHVANMGDFMVVRFIDESMLSLQTKEESGSIRLAGNWGNSRIQDKMPEQGSPLEIIVELGVVGISIVDHKPRELAYLYMERFFISYLTGFDNGTTSRFKLVVGYMQLDNQLPLTVMPVLLAPDQVSDVHHPVFKMTVTSRNENPDGLQIYPYVFIRVSDKIWRLNVHEPIIWAMVDFFNNLQVGRIPQNTGVTQVDPEIRIDLIDISEVRLKISLETAPAQRPHGLLGVWSPVLSAVGNAFKFQVHLRKVMHKDRFLRKSSVVTAIGNRIWRDLIHNPLHLIFSVDVLGMTSSTLASLSKGFAELSTDGQFLQLRSKQIWSRRITGVGDGIVQGTEALAQGVAFGFSGVVRKPMESARQNGLLGLAHGLGQAFLGMFVQPVSGALDFFSLTVDGIGASCSRCLEVLNNKKNFQRIRNPRAFHADHILREYSEKEAVGQMILFLAEASRNFGCTEIFKEPSKYAWSDCYEEHFVVPYQRIVLVTNRRVMLLQCVAPDRMDTRPCKIMWDVPWEDVLNLELAKAGFPRASHLIIHLKSFRRAENFVRVIKCKTEQASEGDPQAVRICSVVHKMWKAYQSDMRSSSLQILSRQRYTSFSRSGEDGRESRRQHGNIILSRKLSSSGSVSTDSRFIEHVINFSKIWTSEQESKGRCTLCRKQNSENEEVCSIWRPVCPDGYVSVGDIARPGSHPPNVAAVYRNSNHLFALPVGFDLVWRNCIDDYKCPVSIWLPRPPEGYVSLGCVAMADFTEPELDSVYCVAESLGEETTFEEQKIWSAPDSYPWACHIYETRSEALQFIALRQPKEDSDWKPRRTVDNPELASDVQ